MIYRKLKVVNNKLGRIESQQSGNTTAIATLSERIDKVEVTNHEHTKVQDKVKTRERLLSTGVANLR